MKKLLVLPVLFLSACATISHGPMETISVDSQPSGAAAAITCDRGVHVTGTTPASLVIPRKADHCVVEVSQGDRKKTVALERGISGVYWLNFTGAVGFGVGIVAASRSSDSFFGENNHSGDQTAAAAVASGALGALGFILDAANGSMWDHNPRKVMVDLEH